MESSSVSPGLTHVTPRSHTEDMTATAAPIMDIIDHAHEMAPRRTEFSDIDFDIERMAKKIDQINARVAKKGLEGGFTYRIESRQDDTSKWEVLSVEGVPAKANGWTLVASVSWEGDTPITSMVPGYEGPIIDRATLDGHCDICNAQRVRTHVIVCEHPVEGRQVVGGQCVKDLLGHDYPVLVWPSIEMLGEEFEGGFGAPQAFTPAAIVRVAIAATKAWGWVSRSNAHAYQIATADRVEQGPGEWSKTASDRRATYQDREDASKALALLDDEATLALVPQVLAWAQTLPQTSEFNMNLSALASQEWVSKKRIGTLAYAFTGYTRHLEREAKRAAERASKPQVNNAPLGQAKDKVSFEAMITGVKFIEGDYGTSTLVKFSLASGQVASWFASNTWIDEHHIGVQVSVKASVKGTKEFRGDLETQITRATVTPTGSVTRSQVKGGTAYCWKCGGIVEETTAYVQGENIVLGINTCPKHTPKH